MSRKEYIPVGGILTRKNGKCYEVVAQSDCSDCAFENKRACNGHQCSTLRKDATSVIFIRRKDLEVKPDAVEADRPFKKDDPVMVRDYPNQVEAKRYYSHFENGKHYAFGDGTTSWSNVYMAPSVWIECRHPTEEELK